MNEIEILRLENERLKSRLSRCNNGYLQLKAKYDDIIKKQDKPKLMSDMIYQAYPRKLNKTKAMISITKAIQALRKEGKDAQYLLEKTKAYAKTLSRYDIDSKHENWNLVPHPTTWFNQERYHCEESEWSAQFRDGKYVEEKKEKPIPDEPPGWREALKEIYPMSDPSQYTWEIFYKQYPDELAELRNYYRNKK